MNNLSPSIKWHAAVIWQHIDHPKNGFIHGCCVGLSRLSFRCRKIAQSRPFEVMRGRMKQWKWQSQELLASEKLDKLEHHTYLYRCIKVPSRYTKCYDYSRAKLKHPNCQMFFFRDFGWSLDLEPGKPAWRCSREIHKFRWGDLRSWSRKGITIDLWVWNTALEDSQIRLPQNRDHFRRKGSSSNHRFSWDMLVFGGSMWNFAV